jgi:hypothetical protein
MLQKLWPGILKGPSRRALFGRLGAHKGAIIFKSFGGLAVPVDGQALICTHVNGV